MIRARSALVRLAQQMFHDHLVGVYRWDEAAIAKPREVERRPGEQREAGKFHDQISIRLGRFDIEIIAPFEDDAWPCGRVLARHGKHWIDGPLDAKTWAAVADFIKQHKNDEGLEYGCAGGADWGR